MEQVKLDLTGFLALSMPLILSHAEQLVTMGDNEAIKIYFLKTIHNAPCSTFTMHFIHYASFTMHHSPRQQFIMYRSPCTVHHAPFTMPTIHHVPFTMPKIHHALFTPLMHPLVVSDARLASGHADASADVFGPQQGLPALLTATQQACAAVYHRSEGLVCV